MNFNIEIAKMLEVIEKSAKARRFAYIFIILLFSAAVWWKLPDVIMTFNGG
ncbi:Uncharacterised protein [Pasteurella canis]|uniref:Uncharacterized protein n=1 Tax=Pasteurella canis TaxID=753 RepID=A0A379EU90_9PAST|nr:hypothetical protein [Pasteurella canis]SUC09896.1 Uncharacterised protein [Pasteurella canis]